MSVGGRAVTNEEAYKRLTGRGCSERRAVRLLNYAYQAQLVGSWRTLFVNDDLNDIGGSEGIKYRAMEVFRDAGVDPMAVTFPERITGRPPFGTN